MESSACCDERKEARRLLLHVLGKSYSWLFAHADELLRTDDVTTYLRLIERRACGEPLAYLTGRCGFWTLDLEVTPATLIPRSETERLVELALERLPPLTPMRVADLGTGSGAVALALASERQQIRILATDLSAAALSVAKANARRLGLHQVCPVQGDWLAPLCSESCDLVVANPPYIEANDPHLMQGDLRFEPMMALSSGSDGLNAVRRIVREATRVLVPGGWLLFEHGWNQARQARLLLSASAYAEVFTAQDLEARDRVSGGCRVV